MSIIKSMNIISVHFNTVKPRLTATSSVNKNGHFCLAALQNGHTCTFSRKKNPRQYGQMFLAHW